MMANDESEEDKDVTTSVTSQVSTQNMVPSKPQRGYARTLIFKQQGCYLNFIAWFMKNTSIV
jgi:hypothetical protein